MFEWLLQVAEKFSTLRERSTAQPKRPPRKRLLNRTFPVVQAVPNILVKGIEPKILDVELTRQYYSTHTYGTLLLPDGSVLHTLELPWKENQRNISCIPPGTYQCKFLERTASGRYTYIWIVLGVEGRSGILFHSGNLLKHTQGCILPGIKRGLLAGQSAVLSSRAAKMKMRDVLNDQDFRLIVHGSHSYD